VQLRHCPVGGIFRKQQLLCKRRKLPRRHVDPGAGDAREREPGQALLDALLEIVDRLQRVGPVELRHAAHRLLDLLGALVCDALVKLVSQQVALVVEPVGACRNELLCLGLRGALRRAEARGLQCDVAPAWNPCSLSLPVRPP
jgi:hypothetical protein